MSRAAAGRTLVIDVGGTFVKAAVLGARGPAAARTRFATPADEGPAGVVELLADRAAALPTASRAAVGFPGVVRGGVILTAANFAHPAWIGFPLALELERRLGTPVLLLNDADMLGLGVARGRGVEMVVTLGTGVGTALLEDGRLGPHLELAHHPWTGGLTYEQQLGGAARHAAGDARWSRRVHAAIETWRALTLFDALHLGGGNARHLRGTLPRGVRRFEQAAALLGGLVAWDQSPDGGLTSSTSARARP